LLKIEPLFGDLKLNRTYGLVDPVNPRLRFGSLLAISAGSWDGGGKSSNSMSAEAVPVCSCCWALSWLTVSLMMILSTYAFRTVAVEAFHAGLRSYTICLVGVYVVILYGPSEIVCWPSSALAGT